MWSGSFFIAYNFLFVLFQNCSLLMIVSCFFLLNIVIKQGGGCKTISRIIKNVYLCNLKRTIKLRIATK